MKTSLNNIRLIVCDIDGTLTHDGTILPSPYALNIIERIHEKGILFGLASGRGDEQLIELKDKWGLSFDFDMIIGLNGSEYYNGTSRVNHDLYSLRVKDIRDIVTKMEDFYPGLNCSVYRNGMRYLRYEDEMAVYSSKRNQMNNHIIKDLSEMWEGPCPKVMYRVSEEVMHKIEPYAIEISNENYRACKTQTTMLEFVHAKADKGNALKAYCEETGLNINDVAAFGDMTNDNEMLLYAGAGVAMLNASDDCKKCADYITDFGNNDDGCMKFIEKYIL